MRSAELDKVIRKSLRSFYRGISGGWCGREREAISLFAFGHLAKNCSPKTLLSLEQIGIEVAVRQLKPSKKHKGRRSTVCKDLVIWPKPNMTLWSTNGKLKNEPLAVMEWKVNYSFGRRAHKKNRLKHEDDIDWLRERTSEQLHRIRCVRRVGTQAKEADLCQDSRRQRESSLGRALRKIKAEG
jgi:hypothetical protein